MTAVNPKVKHILAPSSREVEVEDGQIFAQSDTARLFLDVGENRIQITDLITCSSFPLAPIGGKLYFNTTDNKARYYSGGSYYEWGLGDISGDVSSKADKVYTITTREAQKESYGAYISSGNYLILGTTYSEESPINGRWMNPQSSSAIDHPLAAGTYTYALTDSNGNKEYINGNYVLTIQTGHWCLCYHDVEHSIMEPLAVGGAALDNDNISPVTDNGEISQNGVFIYEGSNGRGDFEVSQISVVYLKVRWTDVAGKPSIPSSVKHLNSAPTGLDSGEFGQLAIVDSTYKTYIHVGTITISESTSHLWSEVLTSIDIGVANGVAGLDANGKISISQIPSNTFVLQTEKGAANGVATLDVNGIILRTQLPQNITQQDVTVIPAATSAYTLTDGGAFEHAPSSAPTYTFPAVLDTTKTHDIVLDVKFSSDVQTYAFEDSSGNEVVPLTIPDIESGIVVRFICSYETMIDQWVIMPIPFGKAIPVITILNSTINVEGYTGEEISSVNLSSSVRVSDGGSALFSASGLPTGLSLTSAGVLSGTPSSSSSSNVTVTVSYSGASDKTLTLAFAITAAPSISLSQSSTTISGSAGSAISSLNLSQYVTVSNPISGESVSYSASSLPAGLSMSGSTISGTPTGSSSATIPVTISYPHATSVTFNITFNISAPVINLSQSSVTVSGTKDVALTSVNLASYVTVTGGGSGSLSFSTGDTLPNGLQLSSAGVLSGTPTASSSATVAVTVSYPYATSVTLNVVFAIQGPVVYYTVSDAGSTTNGDYVLYSGTHGSQNAIYTNGSRYLLYCQEHGAWGIVGSPDAVSEQVPGPMFWAAYAMTSSSSTPPTGQYDALPFGNPTPDTQYATINAASSIPSKLLVTTSLGQHGGVYNLTGTGSSISDLVYFKSSLYGGGYYMTMASSQEGLFWIIDTDGTGANNIVAYAATTSSQLPHQVGWTNTDGGIITVEDASND